MFRAISLSNTSSRRGNQRKERGGWSLVITRGKQILSDVIPRLAVEADFPRVAVEADFSDVTWRITCMVSGQLLRISSRAIAEMIDNPESKFQVPSPM